MAVGAAIVAGAPGAALGQATFTWITPGTGVSATVNAVTPDGTHIVGSYFMPGVGYQAYRWSMATGVELLGQLPGMQNTGPTSVSADGSVIVGGAAASNVNVRAWVWTESTGMQELPRTSEFQRWYTYTISADGRKILGAVSGPGVVWVPIQWVRTGADANGEGEGEWVFEMPFGYEDQVFPCAMSADGNTIAVNIASSAWQIDQDMSWTQVPIMPELAYSDALGLSGDGSTVVGRAGDWCVADRAFRWRRPSGGSTGELQLLGSLAPGQRSAATSANYDGSIVVGVASLHANPIFNQAFVWTPALGMRSVSGVANQQGAVTGGAWLGGASVVNADGSVISGVSRVGDFTRAWVVTGLRLACRADFDQSGVVDTADIVTFLEDWFAGSMMSDFDRSAAVDVADVFAFIVEWFGGCN